MLHAIIILFTLVFTHFASFTNYEDDIFEVISYMHGEAYVAGETEGTVYSMDPHKRKRRKREHGLNKL